jgi:Protein of unknown function (DUF1440)
MAIYSSEPNIWKSAAAGAAGGLAGALAMNQFQAAISAVARSMSKIQGKTAHEAKQESGGDDATVKAANAISTTIFRHDLTGNEKKWAGPAVHYGLGTTLGAIYGALAPFERVRIGAGIGYGAAVWLTADELAVPLAGLAQPPSETRPSSHISAAAGHLVFGFVMHFTRKLLLHG